MADELYGRVVGRSASHGTYAQGRRLVLLCEKMKYGKDIMQERGVSTCRYCLSVVVVGDKDGRGARRGRGADAKAKHGCLLAEEGRDI